MARRAQLRSARPSAAAREAEIRSLLADLGAAVHTHTARVPYGGGGQGAVTDPAALSSQRTRAAFVASTTIGGPYQLAVTPAGSQVGVAMALGNDIGRPDGRTLLDLALERDAGALQGVGLSLDTAEALCDHPPLRWTPRVSSWGSGGAYDDEEDATGFHG